MANEERIPAEILRKVRRIELSTRHLVDDLFGGEYHSVFKGMGMEFDEVREYTPGDEVRSIDWNVTARMGRPFIKRYKEERELTVMLVVDASASGLFGSGERLKSEVIAEVASVLAFSAVRNQDKVGCLIFTDRTEKYIPPEKGHRHVLRIIRELLYFKPEGSGTDLGHALEDLNRHIKRKAVVFLISDFFSPDFEMPLRLASRRHDLIAINIHDPGENSLPDVGLLALKDAETGEEYWLDTSRHWVRKHFTTEAELRRARLGKLLGRNGVDEITLDVTGDTIRPLARFFKKRQKRMIRGALSILLAGLLGLGAGLHGDASAQQKQNTTPGQVTRPVAPGAQMPPGQMMQGTPGGRGAASRQGMQPGGQGAAGMQGMPPGMQGQPGQEAPQLPFTPRAQLDELPLRTLEELTGASRPRYHESGALGIEIESLLAWDIQTIGERNEIAWRIVLPEGGSLLTPEWDSGEFQPIPHQDFIAGGGEIPQDALDPASGLDFIAAFMLADTIPGTDGPNGLSPDTLRYRLAFTSFRPDTLDFPAQTFRYLLPGETEPHDIATGPLRVECVSVLAGAIDSTALRDWKSPGRLRGDWKPVMAKWGLPILLALALLTVLTIWLLRRRRKGEEIEPMIPADQEALEALDALAATDLPAREAFAEYYFRLSQIVRRYLGRRFALPFNDWTSEEISEALLGRPPRLVLEATLRDPLLDDLGRADTVKFARRRPTREECGESLALGRRLVKATALHDDEEGGDA